ncbi:hypothetical protein GW17_00043236 [Ensete ventricosum]|nr:hypothetical protein GW17_00043236 [Ensete ventricosum]
MPKRPVIDDLPRHLLIDLTPRKEFKKQETRWCSVQNDQTPREDDIGRGPKERTFSPLGMYFMATSSLVSLFRINRATPEFPDPISLTTSYFSIPSPPGSLPRGRGRSIDLSLRNESPKLVEARPNPNRRGGMRRRNTAFHLSVVVFYDRNRVRKNLGYISASALAFLRSPLSWGREQTDAIDKYESPAEK